LYLADINQNYISLPPFLCWCSPRTWSRNDSHCTTLFDTVLSWHFGTHTYSTN